MTWILLCLVPNCNHCKYIVGIWVYVCRHVGLGCPSMALAQSPHGGSAPAMHLQLKLLPNTALVDTKEVLENPAISLGSAELLARPAGRAVQHVLRHATTGEEQLLGEGPWTLASLPDDGGDYIFSEHSENPEFLDDIFQVRLCVQPSTGKLLLCERGVDGKMVAVSLDVYRTASTRALFTCSVASRHSKVKLKGLCYSVPRAAGKIYLSFYCVLQKLLVLSVVKAGQPNLFVHKHLPRLKKWMTELGLKEPGMSNET